MSDPIPEQDIDLYEAMLEVVADLSDEAAFDLAVSIDPDGKVYQAWSAREHDRDEAWWNSLTDEERAWYEAMNKRVFEKVVKPIIERGRHGIQEQ